MASFFMFGIVKMTSLPNGKHEPNRNTSGGHHTRCEYGTMQLISCESASHNRAKIGDASNFLEVKYL